MAQNDRMNRREFLVLGAAGVLAGCHLGGNASGGEPVLRFGMVTDIHYADLDPDPKPLGVVGQRYYRESLCKLKEAVDVFNTRSLDFAIELGDFKDFTRNKADTLFHLRAVERGFARFSGPRYHVAGNHDFDCLTEREFFGELANNGRPWDCGYYSFDFKGIHFIVLDACYDSQFRHYSENNPWDDANVPDHELRWLRRELAAATVPVVVFIHQRLDYAAQDNHRVRNAEAVRQVLEESGKVKSVFCGHQHRGGIVGERGITYYGLKALVCDSGEGNNSFAEGRIYADGTFDVIGWRNAVSWGQTR